MNQNFVDFIQDWKNTKIAVAVSGGVDSVCLLHWLVNAGLDVVALHVNHKLRDCAETETQYVQEMCKKINVPCHVFYWDEEKPTSGLEAAARDARYKFMTDFCHKNNIDTLAIAHQADDQIETFLMNLGRGSGIYGLAAIQPISYRDDIKIIRPLLGVFRKELIQYCNTNNIKYFSDEMNEDERYTRVKIRKNRHLMSEKLDISDKRILLAIENLGRVRKYLDSNITALIDNVIDTDKYGNKYALFSETFLFDLGGDIRLKFIGRLIQIIGGNDYQPRLNSLISALEKLHGDCKFTLGHCTIRRLGNRILIVREGQKTTFRKKYEKLKKHK